MKRSLLSSKYRWFLKLALLLAFTACNASSDHYIVEEVLNHSAETEQVPDSAQVCNCGIEEDKSIECSAGTSSSIQASIQGGVNFPISWAQLSFAPGVAETLGLDKRGGETIHLPASTPGTCTNYSIIKQYEIVHGLARVRSSRGEEFEPSFVFTASCKVNLVFKQSSPCGVTGGSLTSPAIGPTLEIKQNPIGQIAFVSSRDGNHEIYKINADGTSLQRLTNNPAHDYYPVWSPDGRYLSFESDRDGSGLYLMNADGSNPHRLVSGHDARSTWSPDGRNIAFEGYRESNWEIYAMTSDGLNLRNLTQRPTRESFPAWSPDGRLIAFVSDRDGDLAIYVMNADGTNVRRITNSSFSDYPVWSPDGRSILFDAKPDGNEDIYVMNADATNPHRLTNNPADNVQPSWSPDGRLITFVSKRDGNDQIYVMNADGTNQRRIADLSGDNTVPVWSPR